MSTLRSEARSTPQQPGAPASDATRPATNCLFLPPTIIVAMVEQNERLMPLLLLCRETAKAIDAMIRHHTRRIERGGEIRYEFLGRLHSVDGRPSYLVDEVVGSILLLRSQGSQGRGSPAAEDEGPSDERSEEEREKGIGVVQMYHRHGRLHRIGGPAVFRHNESPKRDICMYFVHGELHRDDGPARIGIYGQQFWFQRGKLHREDGPAVSSEGHYINLPNRAGHFNPRRANIGHRMITRDEVAAKLWFRDGKLHREGAPAAICGEAQFWAINDQFHRDDGPAIEQPGCPAKYFWKGWRYSIDNPQIVSDHRDENGRRHDPAPDGAAVVWADGTKWYYCRGQLHRVGGPAVEWSNGDRWWCQNDEFHREDGPAIIEKPKYEWYRAGDFYDEETRVKLEKLNYAWYRFGKLHRDDGTDEPAAYNGKYHQVFWARDGLVYKYESAPERLISANPEGNEKHFFNANDPKAENFYTVDNLRHNEGEPSYDNLFHHQSYYRRGNLHRADGPARMSFRPETNLEWYVEDERLAVISTEL